MKRKIALIVFLSLVIFSLSYAQVGLRTTGLKTTSQAILARTGYFYGIEVITNGSDSSAVIVYDNASAAAGTVIFQGTIAGSSNFGGAIFNVPIEVKNGIYVSITSASPNYIVYYKVK